MGTRRKITNKRKTTKKKSGGLMRGIRGVVNLFSNTTPAINGIAPDTDLRNLNNVNLDGRDLQQGITINNGVRWQNVSLVRANLTGINIPYAVLINVNLSEAILENAVLRYSTFSGELVNFTGANLTGAEFIITRTNDNVKISFQRATLIRTTFGMTAGNPRLSLHSSSLVGADFRGANLTGAIFLAIFLTNANFTGANLTDTVFTNCLLTGAIFTDAIGNVPTQEMIENTTQEWEGRQREGDQEREQLREEVRLIQQQDDEEEERLIQQQEEEEENEPEISTDIHDAYALVDTDAYRMIIDNVILKEDSFYTSKKDIVHYISPIIKDYIRSDRYVKNAEQKTALMNSLDRVLGRVSGMRQTPNKKIIIGKTIDFVMIQSTKFIGYYIETLVEDCTTAHEGQYGMSCGAGIYERFTSTVGYAANAICPDIASCNNETYKELIKVLLHKININEVYQDWYNEWIEGTPENLAVIEGMSVPNRRKHFIDFAIKYYRDKSQFIQGRTQRMITEYADKTIGNAFFEKLQLGGKSRKTRKSRKSRKSRKTRKTRQARQARKIRARK